MRIYTILARLLDYPNPELKENLDLIQDLLKTEPGLSEGERTGLMGVVAWMKGTDLIEVQRTYVDTFDMVPEFSLHLTHHLFGDDRGRGPAMVELGEHYKHNGYTPVETELPDYLPLVLEYVSTLDELQARVFLADAAKVTSELADNLEKAESPYAPLLRIVEQHGSLTRSAA